MSNQKHTPEPWSAVKYKDPAVMYALIQSGENVLATVLCTHLNYNEEANANAARIVACVNACAGIEDPEATIPALNDLADKAIELTADVNIKEMVINQLKAEKARMLNVIRVMAEATANEPTWLNTNRVLTNILNEIKP